VDSSFNPAGPNCRLSGPVNRVAEYDGLVEVPVIGFDCQVDCQLAGISFYRRRWFRPLNLDGCSQAQLQWFLGASEKSNIAVLHLAMHSYSFIKWDSDFRSARWNPVDREKLIVFLRESVSHFGIKWITLGGFWQLYSEDRSRFQSNASVPCCVENRPFWKGCVKPVFGRALRSAVSGRYP
jgi:hypothetical protein